MLGHDYYDWQEHQPAPDPRYARCSPNIAAIYDEMSKRWMCTDIGCYGWRPIRAGTLPSSHGYGAARDIRYPSRYLALTVLIPWLINNSLELHLSGFHDYIGCRIWHADRGWKQQTPNPLNGMGQAWATYFHIETTRAGWGDATPILNRIGAPPAVPDPPPPPDPVPPGGVFVHKTIKLGDVNADVYAVQMFCKKYAGNTDIVIDGNFGPITDNAVKMVQTIFNLNVDGVVGPKTWATIDSFANTH